MGAVRTVDEVLTAKPTVEGAGVRLKRAFGFNQVPRFDPFLMLDDFHSSNPEDYAAGFPWHPHRGIETITYMLKGQVEHGDSMGNRGSIGPGDVQWMTAGSGIIHQEMPRGEDSPAGDTGGRELWGLQLWANLPAEHKMTAPRYQEIWAGEVPVVEAEGATIRVISGDVNGVHGPVHEIMAQPEYLDVSVPSGGHFAHEVPDDYKAFAYILEGSGAFVGDARSAPGPGHVVLFAGEGMVTADAGDAGLRFVLISGRPLREPVAWGGPIVMNTQAELNEAFREYEQGTFLKSHTQSR